MELTYEAIVTWMENYFKAYNAYAKNPETVNRMQVYFSMEKGNCESKFEVQL